MLVGKLSGTGSLKGTLSGTGSLRGTLSGGGVGHGIPSGGEPGQGLIKVSDTDYDVKWMSILPEDTASGSVAFFPDGSDDLPMGVVVDIDPVQDLNGYDNPWPGGGGKNKFNEQFRQGSALDLSSTSRIVASESIYVEQGKTYTFSASNYSAFNYVLNSAQADSLPISGSYNYCGAGLDWLARAITFTATNSGYVFVCVRKSDNSDIVPSDVASVKMQFEESSAATAYAPYSNICPISGWTGAKVSRAGVNLFDKSKATVGKFINDSLQEIVNTGKGHSELIPVKPSTAYFMNGFGGSGFYSMLAVDSDMKRIAWYGGASKSEPFTATTPSNCHYIYLNFNADQIDTMAFYEGNTDKGYIPYDGQTDTIPLGQEVYGGTLTVETGELVVDRAVATFDGSSDESWTMTSIKTAYTQLNALKKESNYSQSMKCDKLRPVNNQANVGNIDYSISGYSDYSGSYPNQNWVYLKLTATYDSVASIREWLTVNPVTLVYTLATPITLTLDPVEIRSLLGDNNVWADTGDVSVTYKADIQKYIDKKISAAVAAMS